MKISETIIAPNEPEWGVLPNGYIVIWLCISIGTNIALHEAYAKYKTKGGGC